MPPGWPSSKRFGSRKPSQKSARCAATQLLYGCRDEALAEVTPERLCASYGLKLDAATRMLADARKARGVA